MTPVADSYQSDKQIENKRISQQHRMTIEMQKFPQKKYLSLLKMGKRDVGDVN